MLQRNKINWKYNWKIKRNKNKNKKKESYRYSKAEAQSVLKIAHPWIRILSWLKNSASRI